MPHTPTPARPVLTEPARVPGCTCELVLVQPNAGPTDPYFPGIVRFQSTRNVQVDPDCPNDGWRTRVNVAAILRYGD